MPCHPFSMKMKDGGVVSGFVCTRGRTRTLPCVVCGRPHTKLCDGPPSANIKSIDGTCSAPLCDAHAHHVYPDKDYCPKHRPRCAICKYFVPDAFRCQHAPNEDCPPDSTCDGYVPSEVSP